MIKRNMWSQERVEYLVGYNLIFENDNLHYGILIAKYNLRILQDVLSVESEDLVSRFNAYVFQSAGGFSFEVEGNDKLNVLLTDNYDEDKWIFRMTFGLDKSDKLNTSYTVHGDNPRFVSEVVDRLYHRTVIRLNTEFLEDWYQTS